jgi:hypothetical protein
VLYYSCVVRSAGLENSQCYGDSESGNATLRTSNARSLPSFMRGVGQMDPGHMASKVWFGVSGSASNHEDFDVFLSRRYRSGGKTTGPRRVPS